MCEGGAFSLFEPNISHTSSFLNQPTKPHAIIARDNILYCIDSSILVYKLKDMYPILCAHPNAHLPGKGKGKGESVSPSILVLDVLLQGHKKFHIHTSMGTFMFPIHTTPKPGMKWYY